MTAIDEQHGGQYMDNQYNPKFNKKLRAFILAILTAIIFELVLLSIGYFSKVWPIVIGFIVYFQLTRRKKLLVWLSKFNTREPNQFDFVNCLSYACSALCTPVTIQDTSFKSEHIAAASKQAICSFYFFVFAGLSGLIIPFIAIGSLELSSSYDIILIFPLMVAGVVIPLYAYKFYQSKREFISVGQSFIQHIVDDYFRKIKNGKINATGINVLKCEDDAWQNVIEIALQEADCVVIDVSVITDSIKWELNAISRIVNTGKVIVVYSFEDADTSELNPDTMQLIRNIFDADSLSKLKFVGYPQNQGKAARKRLNVYNNISKKLKGKILECINSTKIDLLDQHETETETDSVAEVSVRYNNTDQTSPQYVLDVTGQTYPIPLQKTKKVLYTMTTGEIVNVISTDPDSYANFELLEKNSICKLLDKHKHDGNYYFALQKI